MLDPQRAELTVDRRRIVATNRAIADPHRSGRGRGRGRGRVGPSSHAISHVTPASLARRRYSLTDPFDIPVDADMQRLLSPHSYLRRRTSRILRILWRSKPRPEQVSALWPSRGVFATTTAVLPAGGPFSGCPGGPERAPRCPERAPRSGRIRRPSARNGRPGQAGIRAQVSPENALFP